MPAEARRGYLINWKWSYRRLYVYTGVLEVNWSPWEEQQPVFLTIEPLAEVCQTSPDSIPEPNKLVFNSQAVAYLRYIKINKIKLIFNKRK